MSHPRRFFVKPENIHDGTATITSKEARHIQTVLRLKQGDGITLLDGTGTLYNAAIQTVSRNSITARITGEQRDSSPAVPFHLGIGLLKGNKMELVIQKATELGVSSLQPFTSRFSVAEHEKESKAQRWQRIVLEACKQCGRATPLDYRSTADFSDILQAASWCDLKLMFSERVSGKGIADLLQTEDIPASLFALIGPEGGFSEEEEALAAAAGFHPVTLGSTVFRAETAALAAICIIQYLLGNLEGIRPSCAR